MFLRNYSLDFITIQNITFKLEAVNGGPQVAVIKGKLITARRRKKERKEENRKKSRSRNRRKRKRKGKEKRRRPLQHLHESIDKIKHAYQDRNASQRLPHRQLRQCLMAY